MQHFFKTLITILVSLSFWVFIAALPPVRIGLWVDSEFVLVSTNILFCLLGASLFVYRLQTSALKLRLSFITKILTATTIWSMLVTTWSKNYILHHLGVPLLGEGTVLFAGLSLLAFSCDYLHLQKNPIVRYSAISAACVAGIFVLCNHPEHGIGISRAWLPYVFSAFLAPMALGVFSFYSTATRYEKVALICLSSFLLVLSHNKTLWFFLPMALFIWLMLGNTNKSLFYQKLFCLCVPIGILIADIYLPFSSLESRKFALNIYKNAWLEHPLSLIHGHGWGYYFETLTQYLTTIPIALFQDATWTPTWDGIERLDFHVMHQGAEHLFSLGVIGLILYGAMILSALKNTSTLYNFCFAVSFAALSSTWFTLLCTWPFLMLGFFHNAPVSVARPNFVWVHLEKIWFLITSILCGTAAWTYFSIAILYPADGSSWLRPLTYSRVSPPLEKMQHLYNYKGLHLGQFLLNLLQKQHILPQALFVQEIESIIHIYNCETSPLILDIAMLHVMKHIHNKSHHPLQNHRILYPTIAKAILKKAPHRGDLIEPFIIRLLKNKRFDEADAYIQEILRHNTTDPFGLWFKGLSYFYANQLAKGLPFMHKALEQHVDCFLRIPKDLQDRIQQKGRSHDTNAHNK